MVTFSYFLMTMLMLSGLFLIGLILLQRGRGGGLAGAFGGMGGQSAFGTKAGDVFTRITIGVAAAWILLCAGSVVALHNASSGRTDEALFAKEKEAAEDPLKKAAPKDDEAAVGPGAVTLPNAGNAPAAPAADVKNEDADKAAVKEEPKPAEVKKPEEAVPAKQDDAKPNDANGDDKQPAPEAEKKPE